MGIDRERVGGFDAGKRRAMPLRSDKRPTPSCVDMEPKPVMPRDLSAGLQRIDHPGIGGPSGGSHHDRHVPGGAIFRDGRRQGARIETPAAIGRDQPHRVATDPGLMGDLEPGEVAFLRHVKHRLPGKGASAPGGKSLVRRGQRTDERGAVGLGAAAGEVPGGPIRQPGAARDRSDDMRLYRDRGRRGRRCSELRVERGGDAVGALRGKGRRRVE